MPIDTRYQNIKKAMPLGGSRYGAIPSAEKKKITRKVVGASRPTPPAETKKTDLFSRMAEVVAAQNKTLKEAIAERADTTPAEQTTMEGYTAENAPYYLPGEPKTLSPKFKKK